MQRAESMHPSHSGKVINCVSLKKTTDNKYRPLKNMYKCFYKRNACIQYKTKATTMDKISWKAYKKTFRMQTFYVLTL